MQMFIVELADLHNFLEPQQATFKNQSFTMTCETEQNLVDETAAAIRPEQTHNIEKINTAKMKH